MKNIKKAKMVGWYDPVQLGRTAFEVFISTIFGKHSDRRLLEAAANPSLNKFYYDFCKDFESTDEFWIDYIADVGDGWNSTYGMAHYLTQTRLNFNEKLESNENGELLTERGNLLIFGGDEVYPTADFETYRQRLVMPYQAAFSEKVSNNSPTVFAIPGNHDWYDSLVSFSRLFCEKFSFAGWKTLQDRSYFAIKLVKGWWLFGTDMQLGSSLDKPQVEYFKQVMKRVGPEDSIILCNAEPHWISSKIYEGDMGETARAMGFFEGHVLNEQVAVYLAGDLHHYRRHENKETGKQKITAGGGGAFLHPTHGVDVDEIGKRRKYKLKKSFPDESTSRNLCWRNLIFPLLNPRFGVVTGLLYLLTAKAFLSDIGRFGLDNFSDAAYTVVRDAIVQPFALYWVLLMFLGFVLFTDTHSKLYRFVMSPIHGFVHLAAVFFISWGSSRLVGLIDGFSTTSVKHLLFSGLLIFVGGWIAGSFIIGFYLLISLNVFGTHSNEAFSSLSIPDYKNFIRLKIDSQGDLTIYPIGVRRVPRKWKATNGNAKTGTACFVPDDRKATLPELIEPPVTVQKLKPSIIKKTGAKLGAAATDEFVNEKENSAAEISRLKAI